MRETELPPPDPCAVCGLSLRACTTSRERHDEPCCDRCAHPDASADVDALHD